MYWRCCTTNAARCHRKSTAIFRCEYSQCPYLPVYRLIDAMPNEIEFELPAQQFEAMGYPTLKQGDPLTVTLDAGVLLPDPAADAWFTVRKEPYPTLFKVVTPGLAIFSGQIKQAEMSWAADNETAALLVDCGFPLRITCAPGADGRLPY